MRKLLLVLAAFIFFKAQAQTPIQVNAQLLPPYSLQVSDYYSPTAAGGQKLNLILLNRDFLRSTINVRLRMVIESQGVRIATREDVTWPIVTLISGTPYYVTPAELANYFNPNNLIFSGISQEQYTSTGKLPEGFYTFCFETVEPATGLTVSNKGCAFAWITISDPPFLNIPAKAETVTPNASQNINFQWTPRHNASPTAGYNTDYVFSITEVMANDFSPESAFTSHQALYTDSTAATMYNYGPAKPLLIAGRRYAWRVQAKAKQGLDNLAMFRNNGYSEVFWFDYKNNCTPPTTINAQVQGSRVTITWQPLPIYLSYKVDYREANNASAEWFTINTLEPTVVLNDLNFSKTYEYRVGASCEEESFNYSNLLSFTTGAAAVPVIVNCGDSSAVPNTVPQTYLTTMAVGDTILAGDFKVKILTISGSESLTGTGTVKIPWLLGVKAAVRFSGIKVNTAKQLAVGNIETTYDPKEAGILNVDDVIDIFCAGCNVGNVVTGQAGADTTVKFPIQWPGGITAVPGAGYNPPTVNGPATITVTGVGGTPVITIVAQTLPKTIMDSTGNIYQVNNTNPITVSLLAQGGGKTMLSKANKSLIDADKAFVKFVPYEAKAIYAFDEWNTLYKKSGTFLKEYEKIACAGGGDCIDGGAYYVSAKAIAPGKTDYLKATVTVVDNTINPDSIQFVNGKGLIYTKTRLTTAANIYNYEIAVVGGPEKDAQEIYALYPRSGSKTFNLGKVLVACYPRKEYEVNLVPVNSDIPDLQKFTDSVNRVFNKININFKFTKLNPYTGTIWDILGDGFLDLEGDISLTNYSKEFNALKNNYIRDIGIEQSKYYLFILNRALDITMNGQMPRGKKFGVIFTNNSYDKGITAAHELGHGIFGLKHTFDGYGYSQGANPDNLLDYSNNQGRNLVKFQWDLTHHPGLMLGLFDKDEDSRSVGIKTLPIVFLNADNLTYTFITYGGQTINVPKTATDFIFHFGVATYSGSVNHVTGVLQEFVIGGIKYTVDFTGGISYKGNNGSVYQNPTISGGEKSVTMAMPNEESLTLYKFNATTLQRYNHLLKINIIEEKDFPLKPFTSAATGNFILNDASGKPIVYKLGAQIGNPQWVYDDVIFRKVKTFKEKPEMLYISKIAQLGKAYRGVFIDFISDGDKWYYQDSPQNFGVPSYNIPPSSGPRTGIWGAKLDAGNTLHNLYAADKVGYYKLMLDDFKTLISTRIDEIGIFFDTVSTKANFNHVVKNINNSSDYECSLIKFDKVQVVLDIIIRQYGLEPHVTNVLFYNNQSAILKILKNVPAQFSNNLISYLSDANIIPFLEERLYDAPNGFDFYTQYVTIVKSHLSNLEAPNINEIINNGFVFQYIEKGADYYTKIAGASLDNYLPKVNFSYSSKAPYIPYNSADISHNGNVSINYFSYILYKLDDDYTFNNKVVFKKSDYPNGIALTGLELHWLKKQEYEFLKSKFNAHMLAGYALVLSGPELAVAKGWRLLLAVADFQVALKSVANTLPQYQQYLTSHPKLKAYSDAWDNFNAVYGVCRITQGVAELGGVKWQAVKTAANDVKNDATISTTIKNDLKIDEVIGNVVSSTLVNSLKAKLTQAGYDLLQTWKANKTITYFDDISQTTLTGTAAENSLFADLNKQVGDKRVLNLGTSIDEQGRFVVECEGTTLQNNVYEITINNSGKYNVYEFKRAYKPTANSQIDVGLSTNRICQDYTKNIQGNPSTQYLCPQQYIPGKPRSFKIEMTGTRAGDFEIANSRVGLTGSESPTFLDANNNMIAFTWHHLDDFSFNVVTQKWECTIQLVYRNAHGGSGCVGMGHTASPKQYYNYFGYGYGY